MPDIDWGVDAEFNGVGGGWSDITRSILIPSEISAKYGIRSDGPTACMASIGTMALGIDNSEANEQSLLGYYTLGGMVARAGFDLCIRFRLRVGGRVRFLGRLDTGSPTLGPYSKRDVPCNIVDWMDEASRWPITNLPTLTNVRADQVLTTIADAVPLQPEARAFDIGSDVYPYAFDQAINSTAMAEMGAVAQSEMGRVYDLGGTLTLKARRSRTNPVPAFTIVNSPYVDASLRWSRDDIKTRADITVHPRTGDLTPVILYSSADKTELGPGQSVTIVAQYVDPQQKAARVGGIGIIEPLPNTDFTANTRADGSGADRTGSLGGAFVAGGDSSTITVTNNHATQTIFVTKLQIRGLGLYDYQPVTCTSIASTPTLAKYGENLLVIDLPYQGSATLGQAIADGVRNYMSVPRARGGTFRFCGNVNEETKNWLQSADIDTCFEYREPISGTTTWFINAVDLTLDRDGLWWATWYCEPADLTHYWQVGVDVLGVSTTPAPF